MLQQMVNEINHLLRGINEKYAEIFHCNVLTVVDLTEEQKCVSCIKNHTRCLRCVIGYEELNGQ
jgi:hypothetical protein